MRRFSGGAASRRAAALCTVALVLGVVPRARGAAPFDAPEVAVETRGAWPMADPDRVDLASGDRLVLGPEGRTLVWTGAVGASPSGFRFDHEQGVPGADDRLAFRVLVDGAPLADDAIRIGGAGAGPADPFEYDIGAPVLLATAPPRLGGTSAAVTLALWRTRAQDVAPTPAAVSPDERRRLRALGYVQ